jgi:hypothetical protein
MCVKDHKEEDVRERERERGGIKKRKCLSRKEGADKAKK